MKRSYKDDGTKRKDKVRAVIGTSLFYLVLLVVFILFGFKTKLPLPDEGGIEVMLGEIEFGSPGASLPEPPTVNQQTPPPASSETTAEASEKEVVTAPESEVVIPEKKEEKKEAPVETKTETKTDITTPENKEENKEPEKKSNPKFEYSKSNKDPGKGTGDKEGNQGDPKGDPNSKNPGHGSVGPGTKWSLNGRGLVSPPPQIDDNSQKEERVVIEITVNKQGIVIGAKATIKGGGTLTTGPLVQKAIASAKKARFTPDPEGSEEQYGTITFNFKLQ